MIMDRESSFADPPQQLRERKNELILELKDCGGGAVMSYMERECVLTAAASSNSQAEMRTNEFVLRGLTRSLEELGLLPSVLSLSQLNGCHCVWGPLINPTDETTRD